MKARMSAGSMLLYGVVSLLFLTGCASAGRSTGSTTRAQDEAAIRSAVAAWPNVWTAPDPAHALSMIFHEDGVFTNVVGASAQGRKAIADFHRPFFENDGTRPGVSFKHAALTISDPQIRFLRPDVASVDVPWAMRGARVDGRDVGPRRGLMMWTMTKEDDQWGISVFHNMDLPVPAQ